MGIRLKIEVFLFLILGLAIFLAHTYYNKYQEEKEQKQNVELLFSKKVEELEVYKNKKGQEVAKNEVVELNSKTVKEVVKDGNLQFLKEFDNLKKSYKNLENGFQIQAKVIDDLNIELSKTSEKYVNKQGDTTNFTAYNWNYPDKWGEFEFKQITPDSARFKYSIIVPLNGVLYWKRTWFLGKKHYFTEVTSENPHIKINKLLNIKIEGKRK